jgi:hypothetical protein
MYPYPTDINTSEGIGTSIVYLNTVTSSWFSNLFLISIYIIFGVGVYQSRKDLPEGLAVAGFMTAIIGTLFWVANWISGVTYTITLASAILGAAVLWIGKQN